MLDSLLGRAELKARIEELETENGRLRERLDAESERRAEAVTARQDAEERGNRLEDRIAELEGRVERLDGDGTDPDLDYRGVERLRGERLDTVLARLRSLSAGPEGALTAMVGGDREEQSSSSNRSASRSGDREARSASSSRKSPTSGDGEGRLRSPSGDITDSRSGPVSNRIPPESRAAGADGPGNLPDPVREAFGDRAPLVARAAPVLVCADDASLVSVALSPPLAPDPFCEWGDRFRLPERWFRPVGRFGFAVVRSDLFAFGVYDGAERRSFEGFESDVMGAHSKGGFSQARFERRRDAQIDDHLDRCREALADAPDPLIVVGERTVLGEIREFADRTAVSDARGDPEEALAAAFHDFWTTRLYRV